MTETVSQWAIGFVAACTCQNLEILSVSRGGDKDGQRHPSAIMDDTNLGDAYRML